MRTLLLAIIILAMHTTASRAQTFGDLARQMGVPFLEPVPQLYWSDRGDIRGNPLQGSDIDGKVGYPLNVRGPRMNCPGGQWSADMGISSGTLPPGLVLGQGLDISGVPRLRGHWIVTMKITDVKCNGHRYSLHGMPEVVAKELARRGSIHGDYYACAEGSGGFCGLQTLRFHITGAGVVVD